MGTFLCEKCGEAEGISDRLTTYCGRYISICCDSSLYAMFRGQKCKQCEQSKRGDDAPVMSKMFACEHAVCMGCLSRHWGTQMAAGLYAQLRCPVEGCHETVVFSRMKQVTPESVALIRQCDARDLNECARSNPTSTYLVISIWFSLLLYDFYDVFSDGPLLAIGTISTGFAALAGYDSGAYRNSISKYCSHFQKHIHPLFGCRRMIPRGRAIGLLTTSLIDILYTFYFTYLILSHWRPPPLDHPHGILLRNWAAIHFSTLLLFRLRAFAISCIVSAFSVANLISLRLHSVDICSSRTINFDEAALILFRN